MINPEGHDVFQFTSCLRVFASWWLKRLPRLPWSRGGGALAPVAGEAAPVEFERRDILVRAGLALGHGAPDVGFDVRLEAGVLRFVGLLPLERAARHLRHVAQADFQPIEMIAGTAVRTEVRDEHRLRPPRANLRDDLG